MIKQDKRFDPHETFHYYNDKRLFSSLQTIAKDLENTIQQRYGSYHPTIALNQDGYTETYFNDYGNSATLFLNLTISSNTEPQPSTILLSMPIQIEAFPYRSLSIDPLKAWIGKIPKEEFIRINYISGDMLDIIIRGTYYLRTKSNEKLLQHIDNQIKEKLLVSKQ